MNTTLDILEDIITVIAWIHATIVVISSALVVLAYALRKAPNLRHVAPVAAAHCILTLLTVTGLQWGFYHLYSWRGFMVFLAYSLTIYGLAPLFWTKVVPKLWPNKFEEH